MKRHVYIVDDEEPVRRSTRLMLMVAGFAVETFESGSKFLEAVPGLPAGAVLLDLRMPETDGLEVQRQLLARDLPHQVIMLTGHGDVGVAVTSLQLGASGFLEKPFPKILLMKALARAFRRLEQPDAQADLRQEAEQRMALLSAAEREVLGCLAQGLSNETIASALGLSTAAVEVHRAKLLSGLGAETLFDALILASDAGLDPPHRR